MANLAITRGYCRDGPVRDLLYAFVIVRLDRSELIWINATANPTAEWVCGPTKMDVEGEVQGEGKRTIVGEAS
jgi:hypothetical protein